MQHMKRSSFHHFNNPILHQAVKGWDHFGEGGGDCFMVSFAVSFGSSSSGDHSELWREDY
jgi:hypothetical protein